MDLDENYLQEITQRAVAGDREARRELGRLRREEELRRQLRGVDPTGAGLLGRAPGYAGRPGAPGDQELDGGVYVNEAKGQAMIGGGLPDDAPHLGPGRSLAQVLADLAKKRRGEE